MKIKKGDEVKVIRGKDKGKTGKIDIVFPKTMKVVISGINEYKRHIKARSMNQKSEIVTVTKPLAMANVQVICGSCHLPTRVGYKVIDNKKQRVCKKCDQVV